YGHRNTVSPNYEAFESNGEQNSENERTEYKQAALKQEDNVSNSDEDKVFRPTPGYNKFIEKPISKLAHCRGGDSYLVSYPNENKKTSTEGFKDAVYFVKKEARYQDEIYYLLSTKRSAVEGIIGWIETKHLVIHDHILVDH